VELASKSLAFCVNQAYEKKLNDIFQVMCGELNSQSNRKIVNGIKQLKLYGNLIHTHTFKVLYFTLEAHLKREDIVRIKQSCKGDLVGKTLKMAERVKEIDDENLVKVWPRVKAELIYQINLNFSSQDFLTKENITTAKEIRKLLIEKPELLAVVRTLNFNNLDITFLPEEIVARVSGIKKLLLFNTSTTLKNTAEELFNMFSSQGDKVVRIIMT